VIRRPVSLSDNAKSLVDLTQQFPTTFAIFGCWRLLICLLIARRIVLNIAVARLEHDDLAVGLNLNLLAFECELLLHALLGEFEQ